MVTLVLSVIAEKPDDRPLWPGGFAFIVGAALVLALRRRHPVLVLAVTTAVPPMYYPLGYPDGPIALVFVIALFNAAVELRLLVPLGAVIVANAGFLLTSVIREPRTPDPDAIRDARGVASLSIGLLVTIAAGLYVRSRRDRVEEAELQQTSAAGLRVLGAGDVADLDGAGPAALAGLPVPVGLAGYRIVQEALTNTVRHAGATGVTVEVRRTADAVLLQIDDDGAGPLDPAALARGNGLRGMRERACAVGGEMTAGPGPAGGFRVWARLPLGGPEEQAEDMEGMA